MMQHASLKIATVPYRSIQCSTRKSPLASFKNQRCCRLLSTQATDKSDASTAQGSPVAAPPNQSLVDTWFRWTNGSSVVDLKEFIKERPKLDGWSEIYSLGRKYSPPSPTPTQTQPAPEPKSYITRWFQKHGLRGQGHRMEVAGRMFQAARRQAMDPRWYGPGRIGRDFQSRHAVLTMHFWFLHHRLSTESPFYTHEIDQHGSFLMAVESLEHYWSDSTSRLRNFGINEWTMSKHMNLLQKVSFAHMQHYDRCFALENPVARKEELRIAVRRHVLGEDWLQRPQPQHVQPDGTAVAILNDVVDRLVAYIECQHVNILERMPDSYFHQGHILWVDLPDFSNIKDNQGKPLELKPLHEEDILPIPWEQHWTLSGEKYYWNLDTNLTQTEHPGSGGGHSVKN